MSQYDPLANQRNCGCLPPSSQRGKWDSRFSESFGSLPVLPRCGLGLYHTATKTCVRNRERLLPALFFHFWFCAIEQQWWEIEQQVYCHHPRNVRHKSGIQCQGLGFCAKSSPAIHVVG
jgi:hypothetical protein